MTSRAQTLKEFGKSNFHPFCVINFNVCREQIFTLFEVEPDSILAVSAKLGTGVTDLLDAVVTRVPPPHTAGRDTDLRQS